MRRKLFNFEVTKETWLAVGAGVIAILLSVLLKVKFVENRPLFFIAIRDWFMIVGIGVLFVITRIKKEDFETYGLTLKGWKKNLLINVILAVLLAIIMLLDIYDPQFIVNANVIYRAIFIMIAGVFEVLFFYTYQRVVFEKAFGKIPAVILVALFYSFHHAGFQPEFLKLFFVGISFVVVVSLTNNPLSIYPFYWGVGATLDVLIQSQVVESIEYPAIRSIIMLGMIIAIIYGISKRHLADKENKTAIGA